MDKEEERIMKLFEDASTGSTIPDPFSVSDDGQYGSDADYDPRNDDVSSARSNTSVNRTARRSKLDNRSNNRSHDIKWVDKTPVHMITTLNHPKIITEHNRHGQPKSKPLEISIYNKYMSGIDRSDQMVSYYSSPSKTVSWYKKVIFHILDLAVWNSYYIYKKYRKGNAKSYEFLHFREYLIFKLLKLDPTLKPDQLIKHHRFNNRQKSRNESVPSPSSNENTSFSNGHWPEKVPKKTSSNKSTFLKCKMCTKNKTRQETSYRCKGWPDKPALCPSCFEEWHNQTAAH